MCVEGGGVVLCVCETIIIQKLLIIINNTEINNVQKHSNDYSKIIIQ